MAFASTFAIIAGLCLATADVPQPASSAASTAADSCLAGPGQCAEDVGDEFAAMNLRIKESTVPHILTASADGSCPSDTSGPCPASGECTRACTYSPDPSKNQYCPGGSACPSDGK